MEKRSDIRHKLTAPIFCNYLISGRSGEVFEGRMKNCCLSGLYAELQTPLKAGTTLVVRPSRGSRMCSSEQGFRWLSLAEVKWSKEESVDGRTFYGTGLKYIMI
jgi:hypothetical protein